MVLVTGDKNGLVVLFKECLKELSGLLVIIFGRVNALGINNLLIAFVEIDFLSMFGLDL